MRHDPLLAVEYRGDFTVLAESEEDAARKALAGVLDDTTGWLHHESLIDEPVVADVSEETWDELQSADQRHLLNPRLTLA